VEGEQPSYAQLYVHVVMFWLGLARKPLALAWLWVALALWNQLRVNFAIKFNLHEGEIVPIQGAKQPAKCQI
jgi:hypothetical protein